MGESAHCIISTGTIRRRVVIIGSGNVAWHLAPAVAKHHNLAVIYSRTLPSAIALAEHTSHVSGSNVKAMELPTDDSKLVDADIYIISVTDTAIEQIVARYAPTTATDSIWTHTSGSISADVFSNYATHFGVLYPLQSFSKSAEINFSEVPILIEGNSTEVERKIEDFARQLSQTVVKASSETRRKLHIAAVFACNFANCMWQIAYDRLSADGLPFSIMLPLLNNTLAKLNVLTPRQSQTGPAARGDLKVIDSHLKELDGDERDIYQLISNYIIKHQNK